MITQRFLGFRKDTSAETKSKTNTQIQIKIQAKKTMYHIVATSRPFKPTEYIKEKREYFDLVTARAVKDLSILNELAIPYVNIKTKIYINKLTI